MTRASRSEACRELFVSDGFCNYQLLLSRHGIACARKTRAQSQRMTGADDKVQCFLCTYCVHVQRNLDWQQNALAQLNSGDNSHDCFVQEGGMLEAVNKLM